MANLSGQNIGANYKGILNLGSTINTPLSTTLQAITDGDGVASPLQLATNRIALGSGTISGTALLNFPDAGTTAADGISFGTSGQIFRSSSLGDLTYQGIQSHIFRVGGNSILALYAGSAEFGRSALINAPNLTGSSATSALSISQTHNTTGSPDVIKVDVVNTASGANTRFLNFYTSGVSQFSIDRLGNMYLLNNGSINHSSGSFTFVHGGTQYFRGNSSGVLIGTGAVPTSAMLSVTSTTQGFLPPRMTTAQKNAIASPSAGLMVYDTTLNQMSYYNGTAWVNF